MKIMPGAWACAAAAVLAGAPLQARAEDPRILFRRLLARSGSLAEGSIRYEAYKFQVPRKQYEDFRSTFLSSPAPEAVGDAIASARRFAFGVHATRGGAAKGHLYYRQKDQQIWRLTHEPIADYARDETGSQGLWDVREMEFNGDYVSAFVEGNYLAYLRAPIGPRISDLEPAFGPWAMFTERAAAPGYEMSVSMRGTIVSLALDARQGSAAYRVEHDFDRAAGYAPVRSVQHVNGKLAAESLYCCASREESDLPTTQVACQATYVPGDAAIIVLWILEEWRLEVNDEDLRMTPPAIAEIQDKRFGEADLVVRPEGLLEKPADR